jgi:hypothetical protein
MSIRRLSVVPLALAFLGCAHGSSESVATPKATSATGTASTGQLVDEGPANGAGIASAGAPQLVPFRSSGGFTVLMPANPQQVDRTEETPGGPVQVHVAQVSDPAAQYVSTYSEYPPGTLEKVRTPLLLDTFQRSSLQALNATLVSARDVQLDGLPGREFTASTPDGQQITARLLVAPGRVYSLAGTYPQGQTPQSVERFLGSFARTSDSGPGVGGSGPASETPANPPPKAGTPGSTEVPRGTADPSGDAPTR